LVFSVVLVFLELRYIGSFSNSRKRIGSHAKGTIVATRVKFVYYSRLLVRQWSAIGVGSQIGKREGGVRDER
jgi:hypothetical protein